MIYGSLIGEWVSDACTHSCDIMRIIQASSLAFTLLDQDVEMRQKELDAYFFSNFLGDNFRLFDDGLSTLGICFDQSSNTQISSTIITNHYYQCIVEICSDDTIEYWFASSIVWLSRIIGI